MINKMIQFNCPSCDRSISFPLSIDTPLAFLNCPGCEKYLLIFPPLIISLENETIEEEDGETILSHIGDAFKLAIETIVAKNIDISELPEGFRKLKGKEEEIAQEPISAEEADIFSRIVLGDKNHPGLIDSASYFHQVVDDEDEQS